MIGKIAFRLFGYSSLNLSWYHWCCVKARGIKLAPTKRQKLNAAREKLQAMQKPVHSTSSPKKWGQETHSKGPPRGIWYMPVFRSASRVESEWYVSKNPPNVNIIPHKKLTSVKWLSGNFWNLQRSCAWRLKNKNREYKFKNYIK